MFFVIKRVHILLTSLFIVTFVGSYYAYGAYHAKNEPFVQSNLVVIDPGHGGVDGGAVGKEGTLEKDLNLQISKKLKDRLLENGFNVVMTREEDVSLHQEGETKNKKRSDLNRRLQIIRSYENAVFLSIHMNSFTSSLEKGIQIFYSVNHPQSKVLAELLEEDFKTYVDSENRRKSKPAGSEIFLLKHAKVPACLIECGFLSNREEEQLLKNPEYQDKLVASMIESLKRYMVL